MNMNNKRSPTSSAMAIVEKISIDLEHVNNVLEVLEVAFLNLPYSDGECQSSCMTVLYAYLQQVQDTHIAELVALLEKQSRV